MSLSAARCVFRTMISGNLRNPVSLNVTFMTLQCHKVQFKCLQTNVFTVSSIKPLSFVSKRYLNTTLTLQISKNYYDILGVPKNADQKQIKDAYYKLAMKHHPDKNQGNLTQQFREIKEAYDVLSNESSRMKYNNNSSNNFSSTSSNWSSNYSYNRYQNPYGEYQKPFEESWTNAKTQYKRAKKEHAYDYNYLRPHNVFINIIKVPKNIVKSQIDILLLTFIKNRTLKLIFFQLFQLLWTQILKNLNFNVLISSSATDSSLGLFIRRMLGINNTVRIELTEMEAIKGKAVRLTVGENEKVLVVDIPRGVEKNQSFILFYLIDDDNDNINNSFKT